MTVFNFSVPREENEKEQLVEVKVTCIYDNGRKETIEGFGLFGLISGFDSIGGTYVRVLSEGIVDVDLLRRGLENFNKHIGDFLAEFEDEKEIIN